MSRCVAPILSAVFAVLLTTLAPAQAGAAFGDDFGIVPGSFVAKTHRPLTTAAPGGGYPGNISNNLTPSAAQQWLDDVLDADEVEEAGAHPDASTAFSLNTRTSGGGATIPDGQIRDVAAELPAGFLGNPQAAPACGREEFLTFSEGINVSGLCTTSSQVGVATVQFIFTPRGLPWHQLSPIYSIEPARGAPAAFGFYVNSVPVLLEASVRSGGDYGVTVALRDTPTSNPVFRSTVTIWGVPAESVHNGQRWNTETQTWGASLSGVGRRPFLSNPTHCDSGPLTTWLRATSWQGGSDDAADSTDNPPGDCDALIFGGAAAPATLTAQPESGGADSPTGLQVKLRLPYNDDPDGLARPTLRSARVDFPEGMTVNPAAGDGLQGCTSAQVGLDVDGPAQCPPASKLGTVEVKTPLLADPLKGAVYQATPFDNPFDSLLAIYLAIENEQRGVRVKLAGKIEADPVTGALTSSFEDNPQLPFTELDLQLKSGPRAPLVTPPTCGTKTTTTELTPWSAPHSGPPAISSDFFEVAGGPGGALCAPDLASRPFDLGFEAGTLNPIAGAHSPFAMRLTRPDGSQELERIELTVPEGLVADLAGVPYCSEAQIAAARANEGRAERMTPSCPQASRVGTTTIGAGAGSDPLYVGGDVYLSGPYKGAPLSLAFVVPAVAGPFDLGVQVVRAALRVDPRTARITAISDEIPKVLEGIPLRVRDVRVAIDREGFVRNPTSCAEKLVEGKVFGSHAAAAPVSNRFQVGECASLGFKPRMVLRLRGGTKRAKHPQLTATLISRAGDANISGVSVAFPRSEFLENAHIRTICTRPDFAADNCPAAAVYGTSTVETPLLDQPLTGNVYLRASDNLLPDIVPDLRGPAHQPIRIEAAGRTDSVRGGIRNTFDFFPDAPFTRAVLRMHGGDKGLLVNSRDICARAYRATVRFTAHNGATHTIRPKMQAQCKRSAPRKRARVSKAALALSPWQAGASG